MPAPTTKSYSLLTLLLLMLIPALVVSQIVMMRQLADARAEVDDVRRRYGHLVVENDEQTFVARIQNEQYENAYRLHIPPGQHYVLHVTDANFPEDDFLTDPQPTTNLHMHPWKQGADVLLFCSTGFKNGTSFLEVHTETEQLIDYAAEGWTDSGGETDEFHLVTDPQQAFAPDDTIRFMWRRDPVTKRGVMLWMEPLAKHQARQAAKKAATEQAP